MVHAAGLQKMYYDENDKRTGRREDPLVTYAGGFYRTVITLLKDSGMSDSEIKAINLYPDKFFLAD